MTIPEGFTSKQVFARMEALELGSKEDIEKAVLEAEQSAKHLEGKTVVKVIVVPGRIVNIVVK